MSINYQRGSVTMSEVCVCDWRVLSTTNVSLREVCQVGTSSKQPVDDLTQSSVRHVTVANAVREMTS